MRTTTQQAIHAALLRGPMTQPQLVKATGLAKMTVSNALSELGIPYVPSTWPRQYSLDPDIPALPNTVGITVARKATDPERPWIPRWNNARTRFGEDVAAMEVTPDSDPIALAVILENGASSLASLAEALREVAGKPDWYLILGGDIEALNVTPIKRQKKIVDTGESTT